MTDFDLDTIVGAVRQNCHISDAQHAGDLTMCTFLLKMRELYRWENGIPLTREMPRSEVGDWMNERGLLWDDLEDAPYVPVPLSAGAADPFESSRINGELLARGYVYSGGYGRRCKPHFFLAELARRERRDGFDIYVSGRELARDLEAPPGMYLDRTLFVRTEALRRWLWEKYEEWHWNRKNEAMGRAVAAYPFAEAPEAALDAMTATELESVILHELGEARAGEALGTGWDDLLAATMHSRAEIMVRAVRDLYADCLSSLPGLIERDDPAAIHFFFANFVGMRRALAPELAEAYGIWLQAPTPAVLEDAAASGLARWQAMSTDLLAMHASLGDAVTAEIEARLDPVRKC
ncbi:MAG: Sfum_1244 family protein [Hydrogenophilaceae bacterium]